MSALRRHLGVVVLAAGLVALAVGLLLRWAGADDAAEVAWAAGAGAGAVAGAYWAATAMLERRLGADVVAVAALVGTLLIGEPAAGAVITVMLGTGRVLDALAARRAEADLAMLADRVPRVAHLHDDTGVRDVDVDEVRAGDVLLVRPGEVIPVDGLVVAGDAEIDESALTGEPMPVTHGVGDPIRSGTVNAGGAFDLRATATAEASTYAGVVRLTRAAQASTAPFVRLADRWAGVFLATSAVLAAGAGLASGSGVRAVAVLVVATPCPLILAAPVAMVSGLSRAARAGVVVKGGGALERLAAGRVLLMDKTGTLTEGRPSVTDVVTDGDHDPDELLRIAASVEQLAPHVLAAAVVRAARERRLDTTQPADTEEVAGHGIVGRVDGHEVRLGKAAWVMPPGPPPGWAREVRRRADADGALTMFVAVDGRPVGAILLEDPLRADAPSTVRRLRASGIGRVVMVTGDRADVAETVGAVIGVDEVAAERTPSEKLDVVAAQRRYGPTIMVGDGVNDAPALAGADVGVAIGARGATVSSEAADVVLVGERLDRLADGISAARRARRVASQSVALGIGLSVVAMIAAAAGRIDPLGGALLQEAIDVAAILSALRALRPGRERPVRFDEDSSRLARRFRAEHLLLRPELDRLRIVADSLDRLPPVEAVAEVARVHRFLAEEVVPHEQAEDTALYPAVARVLGGTDPTGSMSRAHVEIVRLVGRLGRLLDDLPASGPDEADLAEMRRLLYGLHAILRLHFAQEDEGYLSIATADEREVERGAERGASRAVGGVVP